MDFRDLPEDSVLCPEKDEQLIKGLEKYAGVAGISGNLEYIWQSIKGNKSITKGDRHLVKKCMPFKSNKGKHGAVYVGHPLSGLTKKFMSLTGVFVRSYIDARYMSINALLKLLKEEEELNCTVLFIPNFHPKIKANDKKHYPLASWQRGELLSFLLDCQSKNIDLVIGIYNIKAAEEHFGQEITDYIQNNFMKIEVGTDG